MIIYRIMRRIRVSPSFKNMILFELLRRVFSNCVVWEHIFNPATSMTFLGKTLPRLTKLSLKKVLLGKNYHDSFTLTEIPPRRPQKWSATTGVAMFCFLVYIAFKRGLHYEWKLDIIVNSHETGNFWNISNKM